MRIYLDMPLSLSEIAKCCNSTLTCENAIIRTVCTDSREVSYGDLFIAISGERYDGNDFANEAAKKGGYVLGSRSASILVSDTKDASLKLAALYKQKLPQLLYTVAITGSVGKTTTKELTAKLLSCNYEVHSNHGNFNNDIGLLHTLLSAKKSTEVLVVEMGMNHRGEISRLSRAINPDIAIITNIGTAHIGNLGSREEIAAAKLEICDGMTSGVLLIPKGEPLLSSADIGVEVSASGSGDHSLFIEEEKEATTKFSYTGKSLILKNECVKLRGEHLMKALSFSLSVADTLNIESDKVRSALKSIDATAFRQRYLKIGRYAIYDDTYSSSPEAAIAVMKAQTEKHKGAVSAVLGDMLELGDASDRLHREVGEAAAACGIRKLYAFGKFAQRIADGAKSGGIPEECIFINDSEDIGATAEQIRHSYDGELLIVKASHAVHAERIYIFLKD